MCDKVVAVVLVVELSPKSQNRLVMVPLELSVKLTVRLVEPKPARLKGVPETIVKGPPLIVATPLLSDAPPWLVSTKLAWALEPTATVPKLRLPGETPSWAGVRPEPVTV